jgi:hypothetical protein
MTGGVLSRDPSGVRPQRWGFDQVVATVLGDSVRSYSGPRWGSCVRTVYLHVVDVMCGRRILQITNEMWTVQGVGHLYSSRPLDVRSVISCCRHHGAHVDELSRSSDAQLKIKTTDHVSLPDVNVK